MAARRSSSSRSRPGRSRRAVQSQNQNVGMIIGVGVVAVGVLAAIMMMKNGDDSEGTNQQDPAAHAKEKEQPKSDDRGSSSTSDPDAGKKEPEITPPSISSSAIEAADKLYDEALQLHDDARRAQSAGDSAKFNQLINDSWDKLQAIETELEKYTMWLEEADMGDWKLPYNYKVLQSKLEKYDKLSGRVKRIKPNRR